MKRVFAVLLAVVIFVAAGVIYYIYDSPESVEVPVSSTMTHAGYYNGRQATRFENEHFSFTSARLWEVDAQQSIPSRRYVLIGRNKSSVEYEMTIWLKEVPLNWPARYILPVNANGSQLMPGKLSQDCVSAEMIQRAPAITSQQYEGVTFLCDSHGSPGVIAVGAASGGYKIPITRANGEQTEIGLRFRDLTAAVSSSVLSEIIRSISIK